MFIQNLAKLRPLYRLRKFSWYRLLQSRLDVTIYVSFPNTKYKVAIKLLRDVSWLLRSVGVKTNIESYFVRDTLLNLFNQFQPSVFWDVGSNIGFYSWYALASNENTEVVLLDADQTNYELNTKTIQKNNLKSAKALNVAVSDADGVISFLVDSVSGATGCISSVSSPESSASAHHQYQLKNVVSVKSITLDSLVSEGYAPPQLIKIDVEGAEHLVIEGAKNLIQNHTPLILVETGNIEMMEWFKSINYNVIQIDHGNVLCVPKNILIDESTLVTSS